MFFDTDLSVNGTQSCAACHAPEVGFTGPDAAVNLGGAVYQGALPNHFGNRKPPASAYAGDSPLLHFDEADGGWFGGMFWDGRATGAVLGDPLAEQAQGPFLNPLEQAIANDQVLCVQVSSRPSMPASSSKYGTQTTLDCAKDSEGVYEKIGRSVAAYERSAEVNPFSSKFDLFWDNAVAAGKDVTKIRCGTGGMGGMVAMGNGLPWWWRQIPIAGQHIATWDSLTPSCKDWRCSMTELAVPPATRSNLASAGYAPCSPTSATTILACRRTRTIHSTTCPTAWNPDGAELGRLRPGRRP